MTNMYYTIRFAHTDAFHKAGERIFNSEDTLHIGQTEGCEIRLPNNSQYENAVWAVVRKRQDCDGWDIIRTSPYREHEVRINGAGMEYVHHLNDGDRISFEAQQQELLFQVHHDNHYTGSGLTIVSRGISKWLISALAVFFIAVFAGMFFMIDNVKDKEKLTDDMIDAAKKSVFQLRVDSVHLISIHGKDTVLLGSCEYSIAGTAFLTCDSLLVTARHCIEPWLNLGEPLKLDTANIEPLPVKWALQAETHNQEAADSTIWQLVSYCSLIAYGQTEYNSVPIRSVDFTMCTSRDDIIEFGDYNHQYFWRSIACTPRRFDMMLDDIAYMQMTVFVIPDTKGNIRLATREEMAELCSKANKPVSILGFPESENALSGNVEHTKDELKHALTFDTLGYPMTVLSHNRQIGHGYSGGPVIMRDGDSWCVVGVVSVTDKKNKNRTYSVPVTEVERLMEFKKGKDADGKSE